ncbi:MAG TPA: lysophospholipid acyltransferase family protein [Polyangia bacterium]|nr:lysophospholipid acyltransferase family protein [Polyangia bacterium]
MRFFLSLCFWIFLALSSIALFFGALALWLVTWPFDRNGRVLHLYTCFWGALYIYLNPLWRVRVEWAHRPDRKRPYVIVSNHQSFGDILVLDTTYLPFKWVSKLSVFRVPFIGWNAALNRYVPVVRGDKTSAERMIAACVRWIERGVSVFIFPEGTRSKDGQIGPFKMGAFIVAHRARCQVLPLVVEGTGEVLPKHGIVLRHRVDAVVRVLPPIDVSGHTSPEESAQVVRQAMVDEMERLRAERAARGLRSAS